MGEVTFEFDATTVVVLLSAAGALLIQLLLCFKAKRTLIKFLPMLLLTVSTVVFSVCSASINGWDGLGYLFFALLSFGLILVCGIGWGLWAIARKRN